MLKFIFRAKIRKILQFSVVTAIKTSVYCIGVLTEC